MRRKDREITDAKKIEEIIAGARYMHLGLFDGEHPYVVPLHYGYKMEDGKLTFYMHCAKEGHKIDCLRANNNVFVEIDRGESFIYADQPCAFGAEYVSVMCRGKAIILDDGAEKTEEARKAADEAKKIAEAAQKTAEDKAKAAEAARKAAEDKAKTAEAGKKAAEDKAKNAEVAKTKAEADKKAAENKANQAQQNTLAPLAKTYRVKVKGGKNKIRVKWKAVKGAKGYEILVSKNKKGTKKIRIAKAKGTKKTIKKLGKGKYFIKVRAWKGYKGNTVYGKYSISP